VTRLVPSAASVCSRPRSTEKCTFAPVTIFIGSLTTTSVTAGGLSFVSALTSSEPRFFA